MEKTITALLLFFVLFALVGPVKAQTPTPPLETPASPTGVVTGVIVNRTQGGETTISIDIMLHILDQNYSSLGMLHGKSLQDGSFKIEEVPLQTGLLFAMMGVYQGIVYNSEPVPYTGGNEMNIDLPIYETTHDLSQAQVDQMHVLFNFAQDGFEVKEIYLLSNLGDRTITGTLSLDDNQPASIQFPLPSEADYIFFEPNDSTRFVENNDGFVDTAPLAPGERSGKLMVSYLLPLSEQYAYSYTAPIDIKAISFLLPTAAGVTLSGEDLGPPQIQVMGDNTEYLVYSLEDLPSGQTINLTFSGQPILDVTVNPMATTATKSNGLVKELAIGGGALGLVIIVLGVWWWRKSQFDESEEDSEDEDVEAESDDLFPKQIIKKIAQLDEAYDSGKINEADYRLQREALKQEAKAQLVE